MILTKTKIRRTYTKPTVEILKLETANGILTGSVTLTKIKVNNVTVEDYQDGFSDEGGFKDISFD